MKAHRHTRFVIPALLRLAAAFLTSFMRLRFKLGAQLQLPASIVLTQKEQKRLGHYVFGTTYLSVLFASIRGRGASQHERYLFTNLSALASFFDDLVDLQRQNTASTPLVFARIADERGLALHLLENIQRKLLPEQLSVFDTYMQRVFEVEMAGHAGPISTAEKGGCSVMLFRSLMNPLPDEDEEKALLAFGYLIQLSDDIFDIWFDHRDGIATQATELAAAGHIVELKECFEQQLATTKAAILSLKIPQWRIDASLGIVHVLSSITRVCLQHYINIEKTQGSLPLSRRDIMVVDMEKWRNRWRTLNLLFWSK